MTTTHTPGRLVTHEDGFASNSYILMAESNWLIKLLHNGEQLVKTQRENVRRLAACWNACQGMTTEYIEKVAEAVSKPEAASAFRGMAEDVRILDWLERNHTLHRAVEALYVVDGYDVEITYDGERHAGPWHGETLRLAYLEAMKHWDKTHGNVDLLNPPAAPSATTP